MNPTPAKRNRVTIPQQKKHRSGRKRKTNGRKKLDRALDEIINSPKIKWERDRYSPEIKLEHYRCSPKIKCERDRDSP